MLFRESTGNSSARSGARGRPGPSDLSQAAVRPDAVSPA